MSTHKATIEWRRGAEEKFIDRRYSRSHIWRFDGGAVIAASAAPSVVREPLSVAANVDPEEAFVASISSCHMLWFLALAAQRGIVIDSYVDEAEGVMEKNAKGKLFVARVTLNPAIAFAGAPASRATLEELHDRAHEECFIANSVKSEIEVRPAPEAAL